jgi:hypothetical protein
MPTRLSKQEQRDTDRLLDALDEADPEGCAVRARKGRTLKLAVAGAVLLALGGCAAPKTNPEATLREMCR